MVQKKEKINIQNIARSAKNVSHTLPLINTDIKNTALLVMAEKLKTRHTDIITANSEDMVKARYNGVPVHIVNRLKFRSDKINSRIRSLTKIASLPDPVGEVIQNYTTQNGLEVSRIRVPIGVILMIYEARPHVSINAGAFCLKSGNAVILRGGSEARKCNALIGQLWQETLEETGIPKETIQTIGGTHHEIKKLLKQKEYIDLVIPRGGNHLMETVQQYSSIPILKHQAGICHVYIDDGANIDMAVNIIIDSKCFMPEVCNAVETILISKRMSAHLPRIISELGLEGIQVRGCKKTKQIIPDVVPASEIDWRTEYLDLIISIRIVNDVDDAIDHINTNGSHHTDSIVTNNEKNAKRFQNRVNSAVVLINASTMFCDGESLGMGAEIGISTDKLHARGPMGLEELTSYKFVISGNGQIMGKQ